MIIHTMMCDHVTGGITTPPFFFLNWIVIKERMPLRKGMYTLFSDKICEVGVQADDTSDLICFLHAFLS
jgi:hypothetical protein